MPSLVISGNDDRALVNSAQERGAYFAFKPISSAQVEVFLRCSRPARLRAALHALCRRHRLSRRQIEVVLRRAEGWQSAAEIAGQMGCEESTVRSHMRAIELRCEKNLGALFCEAHAEISPLLSAQW